MTIGKHDKLDYSIIIPIYNEEDNILELYQRLTAVMKKVGNSYEVIFVNDGSKDDSINIMTQIGQKDKRVKIMDYFYSSY